MPHIDHARTTTKVFAAVAIGLALVLSAARADEAANVLDAVPGPALAPQEVVRIQLEALRRNDATDAGIAVAFRFASPNNRRSTGPLPRFIAMIKQGPYRLMLDYVAADYAPVEESGEVARQRVTLVGAGISISYAFYLSRQRGGECAGCWMTDAVTVEPFEGSAA